MYKNNSDKLKIFIRHDILKIITNILLSENLNIHLKDILHIKDFLSIVDVRDPNDFNNSNKTIDNIPIHIYLEILNELIEINLSNNAAAKAITIQKLSFESKNKESFNIIYKNRIEVSNEDIDSVKKFISSRLSSLHIYKFKDEISNFINEVETEEKDDIEGLVNKYKEIINKNYMLLNQFKVKTTEEKLDSGLDINDLTNLAHETIKKISTPGFFIDTGLLNLDKAMGGGLKRGALTLFGAKTAGFKSGLMLNLACSIKMYSKHIKTFDPTKRACIVYLSMENIQSETFQRVVKYTLNKDPKDMIDSNPNEIAREVLEALTPEKTADKDVELKLLYKKSNSINIYDIRSIIENLEAEGYEVIALFVDYLSTMNSINYKPRDQETTGLAVADNSRVLYDLAIEKSIAIVSAYQLNRKNYEKHNLKGKEVLSHTGDSIAITRYADYIFVINKDKILIDKNSPNAREISYIRFDEAKQRSVNASYKGYFYELFSFENSFRLIHSKYYKNNAGAAINFDMFDEEVIKDKNEKENKEKTMFKTNQNNYGGNMNMLEHYDIS